MRTIMYTGLFPFLFLFICLLYLPSELNAQACEQEISSGCSCTCRADENNECTFTPVINLTVTDCINLNDTLCVFSKPEQAEEPTGLLNCQWVTIFSTGDQAIVNPPPGDAAAEEPPGDAAAEPPV